MLVAVRRGLVIVLAELYRMSVSKAGLGGVVVAELSCAAVTPWRTFDVVTRAWRGYIGARDGGMLGG